MLLDSNIFIYAALPEHDFLRPWFAKPGICASNITRLEVLGYHRLSETDKHDLNRLFQCVTIHPLSSSIIELAIQLRQQRKMSLGDAVIAATALEYRQTLVTRNTDDFDWLEGLKVINPFE
jgi:predicted nucleic acid-binding protein